MVTSKSVAGFNFFRQASKNQMPGDQITFPDVAGLVIVVRMVRAIPRKSQKLFTECEGSPASAAK